MVACCSADAGGFRGSDTVFGRTRLFRQSFRQFIDREVKPNQERWRERGIVDRAVWHKAGAAGFLCPWMEEEHGGPGGDFLFSVVIIAKQLGL